MAHEICGKFHHQGLQLFFKLFHDCSRIIPSIPYCNQIIPQLFHLKEVRVMTFQFSIFLHEETLMSFPVHILHIYNYCRHGTGIVFETVAFLHRKSFSHTLKMITMKQAKFYRNTVPKICSGSGLPVPVPVQNYRYILGMSIYIFGDTDTT
jgi:hypothetical protein